MIPRSKATYKEFLNTVINDFPPKYQMVLNQHYFLVIFMY